MALQLNQVKLERGIACTWAIYYENSIRYRSGHDEVARLQYNAKQEIPRILSEAWSPNMVQRFLKKPNE